MRGIIEIMKIDHGIVATVTVILGSRVEATDFKITYSTLELFFFNRKLKKEKKIEIPQFLYFTICDVQFILVSENVTWE